MGICNTKQTPQQRRSRCGSNEITNSNYHNENDKDNCKNDNFNYVEDDKKVNVPGYAIDIGTVDDDGHVEMGVSEN